MHFKQPDGSTAIYSAGGVSRSGLEATMAVNGMEHLHHYHKHGALSTGILLWAIVRQMEWRKDVYAH